MAVEIFNYDHLKFKFHRNLLISLSNFNLSLAKNFETTPFVQFQNSLVVNRRENGTGCCQQPPTRP